MAAHDDKVWAEPVHRHRLRKSLIQIVERTLTYDEERVGIGEADVVVAYTVPDVNWSGIHFGESHQPAGCSQVSGKPFTDSRFYFNYLYSVIPYLGRYG